MPTEIIKNDLSTISYRFYENLYALRIFNEQIGQLAENYDQNTKGEFFSKLVNLTGLSEGAIDTTGNTPFELRLKHKRILPNPPYLKPPANEISVVEKSNDEIRPQESDVEKNTLEVEITDEQQFFEVVRFLRSSKKYSPRQSRLLRQGALITLISYFESLESELLNFYYLKYPAALPSDGKLLSLADLREIGSIDEAEKLLIMKEIDAFLHESTEGQIDYFVKRLKVDMKCAMQYVNYLVEITLRRNLFVHNNGVVNKFYTKRLDKELLKQYGFQEGDELEIDGDYLSTAIDIVCVIGTMLIQQSWRKWDEKSVEIANQVMREYTYDLLIEKRWELVNKIADYASTIQFTSDIDSRIIKINQAIALKEQNRISEMENLLNKLDWSSCAMKFHVANFALREQYDRMLPLLAKAVAADELEINAIKEWPLFRWFRESQYYQPFCEHVFSQKMGG